MTDETLIRRTPLQDRAAELTAASARGAVTLAELPPATMLNLRVRSESLAERALGLRLPPPLRATSAGGVSVLWLGPDEFLVIDRSGTIDTGVSAALGNAVDGRSGSVVDVSANRTTLTLAGPYARDVLDKGIAIDLHPSMTELADGTTWCAQTLLTSVSIILWHTDDQWQLLVRPSFANYLADWLIDAAAEFTAG